MATSYDDILKKYGAASTETQSSPEPYPVTSSPYDDILSKYGVNQTEEDRRLRAAYEFAKKNQDRVDKEAAQPEPTEEVSAAGALGTRFKSGLLQTIGGAQQSLGEAYNAVTAPQRQLFSALAADEEARKALESPYVAAEEFAKQGADVAREARLDTQDVMEKRGIKRPESVSNAVSNPKNALEYYGGILSESSPMILAAIATRNPELASGLMGTSTAASTYGQARAEGRSPGEAAKEAMASGAIEAALGVSPFKEALAPGGLLKRAARTTAAEVPTEAVTSGGQYGVQQTLRGEKIDSGEMANQMIDAAIVAAGMGGGEAVLGSGVRRPEVEGIDTANKAFEAAGVEPVLKTAEGDTTAQDRGIDVTGPDLMRNPPPIEEAPVSTPTAEKPRVRIVDGEVVPVAPTEAEAQQVTPTVTPEVAPEAETTVEAPQQPVEVESPITGARKRKVVDDRQQAAEEVSQPLSPEETAAFRTEVAQKLTDMGISEQEAAEIAQADPNPRELVEPVTPQREEAAIKEQRLVPPNPRVQTTDKMEVAYDLTNEVENAEILERLEDSPIIRKTYEQELAKGEQGSVKNVLKAARMDSARTTPYLNNFMAFLEMVVDKFNLKLEKTRADSTALGTFNRLTNAVAFRKASPEAVAHEVTHGVTVALLDDIRAQEANPALKKAVDDINTLYNTISDVVNTERTKEIKGFSEMRKWMLDYGIKNVKEFVAVGMTNPEFQTLLKQTPDPTKPRRSMWQSLKDFLTKSLKSIGMKDIQGTALDALMDNFSTMMAVANQNPELVKGAVGRMKERARKEVGLPPVDEMSIPSRRATTKKKEENAKKKAATAESKAGFVAPATPASDVKAVGEAARTKGDYATEMKRDFQSRKGKAKRYTERLLTSARGIPRDLKEAMDAASFRNTRDTVKAEQYMNKLGARISKLSEADAKEATRLISLSMEGSKDKQASALAALKRLDPEVHSDFILWRGVIDKNSVVILREIMAKKVLTDKDAALVRVISNNLGSYLTRTYKSTYGEEGKKFAKKRWDKYEAWKNGKQEIDEDVQIVLNGINYLKNQLSIGQFSEVEKMASGEREVSLAELEALHEAWISKDDTKVGPLRSNATEEQKGEYADALIKELLDAKEKIGLDKYEQRLNEQAENAAQGLLGLSNNISKMVELFKGARQDMTILRERKLPKALRELLGEITDPLTQLFATSIAQNSFINKQRMLNEMLEIGKGVYFEERAKADFDKYSSELTGETLGPLQGYMATPRVAEVLDIYKQTAVNLDAGLALASRPGMESEVAFSAIRGLIKSGVWRTANTWKFSKVIGNPWNWNWAFWSGWLQMVKDGYSPVSKHTWFAFKAVKDLIGPAYRNYISKEAETALLAGITDSAQVGELTEALRDRIVEQITGKKPGAFKRFLFKTADFFNALDLVWRIAALSAEMEYQTNLASARGKKLTEEQVIRISGQRIRNRHMNYREAIPAAKLVEKVAFATFLTYFSEVFRSLGNTYAQGFADIKNGTKEGGKAGALQIAEGTRKVLGATTVTMAHGTIMKGMGYVGGSILNTAFEAMSGGDDDDELRKRFRREQETREAIVESLASYHKGKMWDVMGATRDGKQVVLWEPGRLDPYDPANEILRHLMDGDVNEAAKSAAGLLFGNPGAVSLLNVGMTTASSVERSISGEEMDKVKEPGIARQYPETYAALKTVLANNHVPKKATDTFMKAFEIPAPPIIIEPIGGIAASLTGKDQKTKAPGAYWMEATGMQLANINPEYYAKTLKYEVQGEFQKLRKNLKENITPGTSSKALRNEYASAIEKERELANRTKEVVRGMRALGWDTTTIESVLSKSGLSKTKQTEALSGAATITSEVLTKNVLQDIINDGKMDKVELQTLINAAGIRGIELEDKKEKGEKKEKSFGGMRGTKWR